MTLTKMFTRYISVVRVMIKNKLCSSQVIYGDCVGNICTLVYGYIQC